MFLDHVCFRTTLEEKKLAISNYYVTFKALNEFDKY